MTTNEEQPTEYYKVAGSWDEVDVVKRKGRSRTRSGFREAASKLFLASAPLFIARDNSGEELDESLKPEHECFFFSCRLSFKQPAVVQWRHPDRVPWRRNGVTVGQTDIQPM